jgi:hypothetical protein
MLSEPKNKQRNGSQIHQFVVLNQILLFNMASLSSVIFEKNTYKLSADRLRPIRRAMSFLSEGIKKLDQDASVHEIKPVHITDTSDQAVQSPDEILLNEQLQFIAKISSDINKAVNTIASGQSRLEPDALQAV